MSKNQKNNLSDAMPVIFGIVAMVIVIITSVVVISNGYNNRYEPEGPTPAPTPDPEPIVSPYSGRRLH